MTRPSEMHPRKREREREREKEGGRKGERVKTSRYQKFPIYTISTAA
jgi:hypothetical protein